MVGFFQSFLVSVVYMLRAQYFIYRVVQESIDWRWRMFEYIGVNAILAYLCTLTLYLISPAASGSGIPDVKVRVSFNGFGHEGWREREGNK